MNLKFLSKRNLLLLAAAALVIAAVVLWRLWPQAHGDFVESAIGYSTKSPCACGHNRQSTTAAITKAAAASSKRLRLERNFRFIRRFSFQRKRGAVSPS